MICEDGSYYVGSTEDLTQRIRDHTSGKGSGHTKGTRPKILAWYESHRDKKSAYARERQIKGWSRAKKNALARGTSTSITPSWTRLAEHAGQSDDLAVSL